MPDIAAQNTVNAVSNDVKFRFNSDLAAQDYGNGQFLDTMMASLTALGGTNDDLKDLINKINQSVAPASDASSSSSSPTQTSKMQSSASVNSKAAAPADPSNADNGAAAQNNASASAPALNKAKAELREKIKTKIKEIAASNPTPVKDDRVVQALKKVAAFLLQAQQQGKIDLPQSITQKLQDFINQADTLTAGGLANFMQDFTDAFRQLKINLPSAATSATPADPTATPNDPSQDANTADAAGNILTWPQDIVDALKDLNLGGYAPNTDKPVTLLDAIRAVKALVTANEKEALSSLQDKAKDALAKQDPSSVAIPMVPVAAVQAAVPKKDIPLKVEADAAAALAIKASDLTGKAKPAAALTTPATPATDPAKVLANAASPVAPKKEDALLAQPKIATPQGLAAPAKNDSPLALPEAAKQSNSPQIQLNAGAVAANGSAVVAAVASDAKDNTAPALAIDSASSTTLQNPSTLLVNDQSSVATTINQARFANLVSGSAQTQIQTQASTTSPLEQVIVQLQARANKSTQISVQLTPAELGRVDVRLDIKRDGQAHAVITVDKPETLSLLQKDAPQLQKALQQAGINANAENMSFNLREQRQTNQGFTRSKRLAKEAIEGPSTDLALNVHSDNGIISDTRVNYHA